MNLKTVFICALIFNSAFFRGQDIESRDTIKGIIDEVIVTGTRIAKRIIDIPFPVSRINFVDYKYNKKAGINDILESVPGLFMLSRYGNHDVKVSIRGFGSKSRSGIRGVRILLDGIPESEPDGQTRIEAIDFNSVGQIEIARGNLSSLYTNAPGGVINFVNDLEFDKPLLSQFNQFGTYGMRRNGLKFGFRNEHYGVLGTYSNHSYAGYRDHNTEHWNIVNAVIETTHSGNSSLKLLFYFVDGMIKLPGSLTKGEFESDPFQAEQRAIDRDTKRISTKGRLGIRYNSKFGHRLNNEIEITTYATIKYFERTNKEYRIINRNGLGLRVKYINRSQLFNRKNEFIAGTDLLFQPARTEYYQNINGTKGDQILQLVDEKISNTGLYFANNLEIIKKRLFVLFTGRYDNITFKLREETLPSRTDNKNFSAFVPKLALNYKLTEIVSLYTSYGFSYDSPAKNELESFDPEYLYNKDLKAKQTNSYEFGIKGFINRNSAIMSRAQFEITFFNLNISNEVVPYEVFGEVYFRNAAKTVRRGLEIGTRINVVDQLDFILAYTFSDFYYDSYSALSLQIDSAGSIIEAHEDYSGRIVPSIPRNNLFLALTYGMNLTRNMDLFSKVSFNSVSGLWVDDANTDQTSGYNILNLMAGIDYKLGKLNLLFSCGVNNLFDEVYVGFINTNSAEGRYYEPGEPMSFFGQLNIGYRF